MKKILYSAIAIIIMGLSVGTYYFYNQNAKSQTKIIELEKEINKYQKDIKRSKETINKQNNIIKTYEAVLDEEILIKNENTDSGYSNIKLISVNKLIDLMAEEEDFILLISQTYCSHCISFKPIYNEVLKENNLTGYEIDLLTLTEKQEEHLEALIKGIEGTPTTIFFKDGKELKHSTRIVGGLNKEELTTKFKKEGYIK